MLTNLKKPNRMEIDDHMMTIVSVTVIAVAFTSSRVVSQNVVETPPSPFFCCLTADGDKLLAHTCVSSFQ